MQRAQLVLTAALRYFYQDVTNSSTGRPQRTQSSVVRSNCMDCLDRTNVVQSALANFVLTQQLRQVGILGNKEGINDHKEFLYIFRNGELAFFSL